MRVKQQKSQEQLAFASSGKVKPEALSSEGTETLAAGSRPESQVSQERLMEVMLERENLKQALRRVEENKGAAGVDGMRVKELRVFLKQHWPSSHCRLKKLKFPSGSPIFIKAGRQILFYRS